MDERSREGGGAESVPPPVSVRDTLLRATVDVVSTLGYEATVIDQIVDASGLSRTVLYRHLGGKQGAVLAAARQTLDELAFAVDTALAGHVERYEGDQEAASSGRCDPGAAVVRSTPDRVVVGLVALADALNADLPATTVLLLEAPGAGPDARPLRADLLALIARILGNPPGLPAWSPAGAIFDVLHRRVSRGHTANMPALVVDLVARIEVSKKHHGDSRRCI